MADNDNRYKLWQTISKEYDLPDYNQFSKDMEDATKRKSLHDAVSAEYDLPDFDQFSKDMGYETQTTQQGNQNAQNAKKAQQTAQSSQVEEGRGLPSDNGYSKQKTAFDKAAKQAWNKLAHKGGIKWTIEGHPEVKMVAVTDDLVKKFPQLEQSRGYQVPFNMSTGTPIMQNIDDKGNIITPDEASEQYTKILTNQDFDYVPKQETASVQIGSVVNTALSTKGGWLDRMARKSMAQYGDDWEHKKFESDGKEVSSSDVFGKVKQTIYDYYNSVLKGIRTHLMLNSDEEKQAYVDNLYKTGQLKEEDIPKANVLHYVQNVDKEEQIEAVRQAKLNRQLELEMAQEKFNQLPQREKGESDFDYNDRILHEGALYEQDIRKLKKQIAQLDAISDELQGNNTSWKEWGHAFKTSGIGSYHAWDLGTTDLKDAIELNKVANGMKRGMQMTSSDYMALRVMSQANEADAIENAVMPVSYKSKKGGFISAPFTFGFFVGGDIAKGLTSAVNKVAGKVISKAVKGAVLKAGGKKALSAATNLAEKAANTKCVKLFGMLAKDFEKAAFMENTTGAATTGAEILNRHIGTVTESDDGFKMEGESLPTAIIKGEISQNIESQTEFLGEHFPSSLKFIRGMAHTKVGSAMGLRNLAAWLTKVSRTEFATTLKSYATRAGINGVFGEYLEEVAGTAENALLVGDQKFSDLLDVKQQEEVAGSVVLSCLGMGIFGTAIYTGQRGLNMPTYYRLKHLQNKWDNAGLDLFTGDEWAKLKDRIDNTPNEGMKSVMADILRADNMTEEQARAAFNYARCSLTLRGMNLGAMKAAQLGLTDDRHIEQDNAYVEGRQAEDEDKHDIQIEFEDRSHELAERLGISEQQLDNMSDEDLESLTGKDDQLDNLIYDYQTSHAKYQGVVDNADDEIDKAAQEAARQTDMATDKSRGTVRNATIKATKGEEDYGVYIVSGNVATNEDGSINVSESDDMILYYDPKSGKIEHCDAMHLAALGEEVNAEETRNQAIADAKEKAIRQQAGIIDGTVGEGTSFTITDAEGNEHTYEVLADNGDGSAMITMDGNVQDTPVSLQDLQNLKDAEEAKRLEAAKMQRQQYEEEREKQNAPVEDNLDYADIINTNGNVEIAEVVDEEGNAMFPDAEEVFFVQNQGSRAKVMVLDNEGNLQPKLVKKSAVRTLGTMSVDEYRQERQKTLKEAENASEPSLVDETEPSNNVVPTDNVPTDNTTTDNTIKDETQPGNEAEVTTSDETQKISNEQENTPKITLEDGTEVPMLEDGNPDFSQLTAGQVAELYDSQFGEDAGQIITNNVNRSKKALDKANAMTVSGGSFVEQKASKEAKDKAIAEAKEKYDSAKAIEDAYNERMLAKEEDTPEGRMNLIEKARRKFNRMKGSVKDNAQAIAQLYDETVGTLLHRLYDSTGIDVFDDTANTVDEYVASSIAPYSLNYEGTETSKGVKQETGLSRSDFAKTGLLAKEGKGKTIGQLANDLWRDRPANLENITDQDVRNAIIDLITSGQTAFGLKNHIQNLRIAEAENILEQQKRQADELAHAEKQKEEEQASTEQSDDNTEESSNTEATPTDAQEEDKLADMPFEAPSPDEDVPFSAKDKAKDPLEVWNNMTDEEKAAYIENNRVKDTRLVDDVVGKKLRKAIEKIAGMMGATIQWQRTDMIRNGWFNPTTKTVYLALDSSVLEGVQFVFGHEMTHDIKSKSPAMYDELKKLVKEKYGEELFEAMTNDNEKRYADVGKTDDDRSYYEEETVADAIGDMINDLNLTRSIALKMSHPLLAKMHDALLKIKNAFTGTPYSDNVNDIIRTIEMAYVKTSNREAVNTATQEGEGGQRLSLREKPAPKKTKKVYKLMRLGEDGKLYPLFIGSGAEVELGKWYDAESPKLQDLTGLSSNDYVGTRTVTINGVDVKEKYNYGAYIVNNETGEAMSLADFKAKYSKEFAKMGKNPNKKAVNWATDNGYRWIKIEEKKQGQSRYGGEARSYYNYGINGSGGVTTFAMRPGWHAGSLPTMRQIGKGSGKNLRDDTFVWVEGEIPADIDYNEEAQKNADKDIPDHIPTDGYYLKATNANKEASQADRVGWYVAGAFKANRIMSDKEARNIIDEWNAAHPDEEKVEYDWKRESGKDFNAETMSLDTAPSSFEEFLDVVRYSIRNEKERAAAEDAYNFAQENRPDRYSRYAIVNMEKPGAVPQYLEKKTVADNWRRYYNKLKWGNYKLFDLDKPFEDNVKNLVGRFPETFRKKNDTTLSKINELTADYNKRKEEYDAISNSIQELLNGLMKQGRSLAEAESVIRDWGLYKEMDSKYQNLMGIRKQLNELRSGKVADNNNGDFSTENDDIRYSLRVDRYRDELNQWKKDNKLRKDAERPQLPVREPNESAADFLKRVKEYRKQAALWATAPTYEDHLLTSDTAQGQFNLEMQRKAVLTRIVIQDSMLAIRKAQEAIMKEKGVDKLNPAEDAYTAENRSHGKAKNEFEEYNDEFLQPLRKAYNELMQRLGKSYDNVKVYMIAKHGLERNAYIAFKYALDEDYETNEERMNAYNNYKADMDRLNNDADFEAGRIDFAAWKQRDGFIRTKYAPSYFKFRFDENGMTKDYSGLSALFDADDYEGAAADLVKEVEDANPYYTDELWYATNDATKKILRDSYNAGMMTEDNFNFVSGMYRNYIPLRGWGDTNADQVWNYVGGGKGAFNQVVKEAKGRKSLADDPIAYIENMAESAILMNNRNWVKQHLLLLAQNHRTSLLNVSKAWYIKTKDAQGNEEWIPASPQITEGMTGRQVETALEAFEQKMEQMQQNGEATQKREHLEISYPQTNGEEREHEVRVMKGGEEYVIYVNGDPQLAQAVNNTRARKVREGIEESRPQRILARIGRYMAAAYTSMSPLFIPSNYMRDLTMTLASTAIREDARYNYLLRRNMLRHWNTFPMVLSYQNGTLREKVRNGSASRVEEMFYDFMMNGGETGFVTSVDVEDLKKKFKNDLKDLNRMAANPKKVGHIIMNSIETLNRAIEDSNRFMVYMTSIEYGRSIEEAVNNAKDVTLNFNRKGTGEHGWQAVRDMYLFINPAVQSLQTLGALAKHHPFKFTAVTTGWLATGLLVPMLNNLLMSFFGGDDDKDKYWQFTKWDRRNNFIMWIPFTKEFVKIPLAQEFRGFYGVGDMIASKLWGGEKAEESWSDYAWDLAGQIVDMLPLDPTGYDGNIGLAITPNAARPIGELALNVDFTGKPIFKNSEYNKYDPNFTKAYVGTPDWLVRISKMVNSIDNKYPDVEQNAIDRFGDPKFNPNNPAVIDHLLSSYLGGSYTMGSKIIGVATKALNGDDIKMADIPLASKFVSNPDDRPVSKKQGEEFWDMKERHDRAANTLSKLKKKAKIDGDYSTLDIFFGSDEYRQYKEDDKKVKKYEEDRKKEKAQETGEEYRPHKTTTDDVYKSHTTPKDDFEDMKMKQLYEKLNSYKIRYEAIDGISNEKGDAYYKANKAAIDAIEEIAYDKSQIASIKKGFLSDGQNTYDADGMKDIRELRKRILDVLEKANKAMMNNRK